MLKARWRWGPRLQNVDVVCGCREVLLESI